MKPPRKDKPSVGLWVVAGIGILLVGSSESGGCAVWVEKRIRTDSLASISLRCSALFEILRLLF